MLCAGRPDPPYDVRLASCGTLKAVVQWSPGSDNNDPILQYIVYYNTSFDEPDQFIEGARVTARRQSADVRLKPWTNYTFSIIARNSLGESERSAFTPGLCTTLQMKPYRNPEEVCSVSRGADQLVIVWQVCSCFIGCFRLSLISPYTTRDMCHLESDELGLVFGPRTIVQSFRC